MNKFTLFKLAIVFFIMLLLLIGLVFFRKEDTKEISNPKVVNKTENNEEINLSPEALDKRKEVAKQSVEIFCISYNTYEYENYSNIESLYYLMTDEFAEKIKNEYQERKEYITIKPEITNSEVLSFEKNRITLKIQLVKKYFDGSFILSTNSEDNDEIKLVNKDGNNYEGVLEDLLQKTETENFTFEAIFEENMWKINNIEKVN